jgi:hypothetical protein
MKMHCAILFLCGVEYVYTGFEPDKCIGLIAQEADVAIQ